MVNDNSCVAMPLVVSFTLTVKLVLTMLVGVPEITPLLANDNPGGNPPEVFVQIYGVCPPDAINV